MKIYLGLGSNLDDREANLTEAVDRIGTIVGNVIRTSSIYETEPWGFTTDEQFLNMVVEAETDLNPADLHEQTKKIETRLGRIKDKEEEEYTSRIIDIDILFYEDVIVNDVDLRIPHPLIEERNFVLVPLNEIAPDFVHPVLKKKISELLQASSDTGEVRMVSLPLVKAERNG
ncbi:MAG TPA: 2-amino-4-hydroxy-6-hydroxymethyldihydropteridine diphosphokinase [Bacteroidales bacterium]|nr:2-amino-4-hydroxy-6-hydroxymethyldihydropteridine diphosphokinase [Bacteroidales bacterium]